MKHATFYLLNNDMRKDGFNVVEQLVCEISANRWRNGKRILITCDEEYQAIHLDKLLWMWPPKSFIPHNLYGEGPIDGAPVEITWQKNYNKNKRDTLISMCAKFTNSASAFTEVVEFVPYEEPLKQLARVRYKAYRMAGFNINIAIWK